MEAKALPTSMPPPTPCSARAATKPSMLLAWPHSAEATLKITIDPSTNGLRPNWSPRRPTTGTVMTEVSRYEVATQA